MGYKDFYKLLSKYRMITPIWEYELELIKNKMDNSDKDNYLILFSIYFSLIGKGNVCMSLDKEILSKKWNMELNDAKILAIDPDKYTKEEIDIINGEFKEISKVSVDAFSYLEKIKKLNIFSNKEIFEIDNNYLYLRKYNHARKGIIKSIDRLYTGKNPSDSVNLEDIYNKSDRFSGLLEKQEEAVKSGINNNLVITGGPGTGKTTVILFILYYLLQKDNESNNPFHNVYLAAASGKASSRMKESIINGLKNIKETAETKPIIDKIKGATKDNTGQEIEEFTIHRLLGIDFETGGFKYNKNNQFPKNSIFIIDEASMIDICLFNSLLESIPDGSRVFILGDKDQLPSVEVGAVFGDLIKWDKLIKENHIITLDESIRFKKGTVIYKLAQAINNNTGLPKITFNNIFELTPEGKEECNFKIKNVDKNTCPVDYYKNENCKEQKKNIEAVVKIWADRFYKNAQKDCTNIKLKNEVLDSVFSYTENAKILCAENEGIRGVRTLNMLIKKNVISAFIKKENTKALSDEKQNVKNTKTPDEQSNKDTTEKERTISLSNQFAGQVMMINKNNKALNLYNGDTGILVTIEDDDTLYFMVKKVMKRISQDGHKKDEMFKMGSYVFYPFRLISLSEIDLAYAITIHKSQGSDYNSILVLLPTTEGHPLLNRQIVYTAITRTKGNTYILSNLKCLNEAKERLIERDTNIK